MEHKAIHLLDLPDEILLIIIRNLCAIDALYSLLECNKRLDRLAKYMIQTKYLDFTSKSSKRQFRPVDDVVLDRFCYNILPQINQYLKVLIFEQSCMNRILRACQYPNLRIINIINYQPKIFSQYLKKEPSIANLFRKQIMHITITNRKPEASIESLTDGCAFIFSICKKLYLFDMNRFTLIGTARVLLNHQLPNTSFSSHLRILFINVSTFDDCLCFLDGRLSQLSAFTVTIDLIGRSSAENTDTGDILPNLIKFSLISYPLTDAYDCRIVPLLRRMLHLKDLTLSLNIERVAFIDRDHLDEQLLNSMPQLTSFTFHICTFMSISNPIRFLSTNDIEKTFLDWKYSPINCCIDYFSNDYALCHIYSIPVKLTGFMYMTNSFRGRHFQFVTELQLYDIRSFEHDFFDWTARAFPRLQKLTILNNTSQEKKCEISSTIKYLHLTRLDVVNAHIDYVNQFLCHTNSYLPRLVTLMIRYEPLTIVTNNFTNDLTRLNCQEVNRLGTNELTVYPRDLYLYFPSLSK